jgi:hypothetical protein
MTEAATPPPAPAPEPPAEVSRGSRWRRRLGGCGLILLILAVLLVLRTAWCLRDRSSGYALDLSVPPPAAPAPLQAGFGRADITPDLARTVWLAGFRMGRQATAVHDPLWAMAVVLDDGHSRIGFVSLDAIGFFHDDVVSVRRRLSPEWGLDYVVVAATHNHNTPDLMGIWGPHPLRTGVDPDYQELVIDASVRALGEAVGDLSPASVRGVRIPSDPAGLVTDTRPPEVYDADLRVLLFRREDGACAGSLVTWANHPETPWSKNTEITADFPGFLRDGLEHGLRASEPGLGGTSWGATPKSAPGGASTPPFTNSG